MSRPVVVVDTREPRPWEFTSGRVSTVRRALPAGDYSVEGREMEIAIERKELGDLVNTITGRDNRERWKRELEKLRAYRLARVVVEACIHDVLAARYRSPALPSSVLSAVLAVEVDYGIPVVWAGDRASAERYAEAYLLRAATRLGAGQ